MKDKQPKQPDVFTDDMLKNMYVFDTPLNSVANRRQRDSSANIKVYHINRNRSNKHSSRN